MTKYREINEMNFGSFYFRRKQVLVVVRFKLLKICVFGFYKFHVLFPSPPLHQRNVTQRYIHEVFKVVARWKTVKILIETIFSNFVYIGKCI